MCPVSSQSDITWCACAGACVFAVPLGKNDRVVGVSVVFGEIGDSSLAMGSDLAQRAAVDVPFGCGDLGRQG
jgi:hypothetical protein